MTLFEYQQWIETTATTRVGELGLVYAGLGLAGETGEVVEKVKKIVRDQDGLATPEDVEYIRLELGDVLWYVGRFCNELGLSMDEVLKANVDKINDRKVNGKK